MNATNRKSKGDTVMTTEKIKHIKISDKIAKFISDCINDDPTLTDHQIRAILLTVKKQCNSKPSDWR